MGTEFQILHEIVLEPDEVTAAKLQALRDAAAVGISAIDQGDARRFETLEDLKAHLEEVGARALAGPKAD